MKAKTTLIFFLALVLSSCFGHRQRQSVEHSKEACRYYISKNYVKASAEADLALKYDSSNYSALVLKSKIKSETGRREEAVRILKHVLNSGYNTDTVSFLIAKIYSASGDLFTCRKSDSLRYNNYDSAAGYYGKAIEANPGYLEAYKQKHRVLINAGRYDEALLTSLNAMRIFPGEMSLVATRGIAKYKLGDRVGAVADINKAINSNQLDSSDMSLAYRYRGLIRFDACSGNDSVELMKAVADLTAAITYDPGDYLAFGTRGEIYLRLNKTAAACNDFRTAGDMGLITVYDTIKLHCNGLNGYPDF